MAFAVKRSAVVSGRVQRRSAVKVQASSFADKIRATAAAVVVSAGLAAAPAFADGVSLIGVKDGANVASPLHLEFVVEGLSVKPAADGLVDGTGHHHLIVDVAAPAKGEKIPFDDAHKHFGKGQTSVDLELPAGKHTLTLQFANAEHVSYGPEFSKTVTVNVK